MYYFRHRPKGFFSPPFFARKLTIALKPHTSNHFEAFFASKCTDVCKMQAKSDDGLRHTLYLGNLQHTLWRIVRVRPRSHKRQHAIYCSNYFIYYNTFLACDRNFLTICCSSGLKNNDRNFYRPIFFFFQKTIVVNLPENMCDCKRIMINVQIIQSCCCLLMSAWQTLYYLWI